MAELRKPEEPNRGQRPRPTKAEIMMAILAAITALAGCVEQLAR
jgi:hypothetical protein